MALRKPLHPTIYRIFTPLLTHIRPQGRHDADHVVHRAADSRSYPSKDPPLAKALNHFQWKLRVQVRPGHESATCSTASDRIAEAMASSPIEGQTVSL